MAVFQNTKRKEITVRLELMRDKKFTEIENSFIELVGDVISSVLTCHNEKLVNMMGAGLATLCDAYSMAEIVELGIEAKKKQEESKDK